MKQSPSKKSALKMGLLLALFTIVVSACLLAPSGKTATPGDGEIDVSWTLPATNVADHFVASATAPSDVGPYTCATATNLETSCTITGLTNGTEYEVDVVSMVYNADVPPVLVEVPHATEPTVFATPVGAPDAPTDVSLTSGNTELATSWTAPVDDGGSVITGYTATAAPGGQTCTTTGATDCTISGLTNGTEYTVTVTATNAIGTGDPSLGAIGTPVGPPTAPTNVVLTPGNATLRVDWNAPVNDGGSPITGYTVRLSPGGQECTTTETFCVFNGLSNGVTYTATVSASNGLFDSTDAVESGVVQAPVTPPPPTTPTSTPTTAATPPPTAAPVVDQAGDGTAPEALAFTGNNSVFVIAAGLLLLLVGMLGRVVARRID